MRIKNKNVLFVVNSNINFYQKSLRKNLYSLFNAGINHKSIMVLIGGFDDPEKASEAEFRIRDYYNIKKSYALKQNSCDYTTFNFVIDRPETFVGFDYIFYMHDTTWVGKDFLKNVEMYTPEEEVDSYGLTGSWSMNIGLYRIDYLLSKPEEVRKSYNIINTPEAINEWKKWGALAEDYLMNKANGNYSNHDSYEEITMENPYGSTVERRTRYFRCLDLYKSQSNWNGVQNEMNKSL